MDSSVDRIITGTAINWASQYGWMLDLPSSGERVTLPAQLYAGTVIFASTVPTANECQPGGYGLLYLLDYESGFRVSGATSNVITFTSPLVGLTVAKLPSGTSKIYGITADGGYPKGAPPTFPVGSGGSGSGSGVRVMWREILN
jgi:type IV pilus assembly protein PilY1